MHRGGAYHARLGSGNYGHPTAFLPQLCPLSLRAAVPLQVPLSGIYSLTCNKHTVPSHSRIAEVGRDHWGSRSVSPQHQSGSCRAHCPVAHPGRSEYLQGRCTSGQCECSATLKMKNLFLMCRWSLSAFSLSLLSCCWAPQKTAWPHPVDTSPKILVHISKIPSLSSPG